MSQLIMPPDWTVRAACRGAADPDAWFPQGKGSMGLPSHKAAKETCLNHCPVRQECLEYGMEEMDGLWGGTTPRERRKIRLERAVCPLTDDQCIAHFESCFPDVPSRSQIARELRIGTYRAIRIRGELVRMARGEAA